MSKYFLFFTFLVGTMTAFADAADMRISQLPAGSTIIFEGSHENVPAGSSSVDYGDFSFRFSRRTNNITSLTETVLETSSAAQYKRIPCVPIKDGAPGRMMICDGGLEYIVPISTATRANPLMISQLRIADLIQDCEGNPVQNGHFTVGMFNKCFEGRIRIKPNLSVVKP